MDSALADPMSREDIRYLSTTFRKLYGIPGVAYFDIMPVLEKMFFDFPGFDYEILPSSKMGSEFAHMQTDTMMLSIRDDVYDRAVDGEGRDRFTVAHEIGHFVLHGPGKIKYARNTQGCEIPVYRRPEWQAETFAGELLMPFSFIRRATLQKIVEMCGVTTKAASVQLRAIERERNNNRQCLLK